jgi:hypothetical protein
MKFLHHLKFYQGQVLSKSSLRNCLVDLTSTVFLHHVSLGLNFFAEMHKLMSKYRVYFVWKEALDYSGDQ